MILHNLLYYYSKFQHLGHDTYHLSTNLCTLYHQYQQKHLDHWLFLQNTNLGRYLHYCESIFQHRGIVHSWSILDKHYHLRSLLYQDLPILAYICLWSIILGRTYWGLSKLQSCSMPVLCLLFLGQAIRISFSLL